jgi:hydroxyacylglutathione hydrolase
MERLNLSGASPVAAPIAPEPLSIESVAERRGNTDIVDVRSVAAFAGAHVPGSLSVPVDTVSAFVSWFVDPKKELLLVADTKEQAVEATLQLTRMGFDEVHGYLSPSLAAWAADGLGFDTIPAVSADEVRSRIQTSDERWTLLDVRKPEEVASARIREAKPVYLADLPRALHSLDASGRYTIMCDSGVRAVIGASILRRAGLDRVDFFLGSMSAWKRKGLPIVGED